MADGLMDSSNIVSSFKLVDYASIFVVDLKKCNSFFRSILKKCKSNKSLRENRSTMRYGLNPKHLSSKFRLIFLVLHSYQIVILDRHGIFAFNSEFESLIGYLKPSMNTQILLCDLNFSCK